MNKNHQNSEKGQAIVYLVLGLVVFFGFVALAIDGGMVLADRRHEQNAADAASLAGGGAAGTYLEKYQEYTCGQPWDCYSSAVSNAESSAIFAGEERAKANGLPVEYGSDPAEHNYIKTTCGGESWDTAYLTVTVAISATTQSNFLQLIYPNALHNEVEAVSYVDPGGPLEYGNAVVALNDEACSDPGSDGIIMGGSGTVSVSGGNIFSNGCIRDNGGVTVTVTGGTPFGNDLSHITEENWDPDPVYTASKDISDSYGVKTPKVSGGKCTDPGAHNVSQHLPDVELTGLYCVTGSQGLTINNNDEVIGHDLTIFIIEGPLTINGTPYIKISAPPSNSHPYPAIAGVLIYLPPTNSSPVKINGDSNSELSGLILAPKSDITLNGNNEVMYDGQVIGWNVEITGNADFKMKYSGCNGYLQPPTIDLYR